MTVSLNGSYPTYRIIADRVEIRDGATLVATIDDGDTGFSTGGGWSNLSVNQDYHHSQVDTTPLVATWQLTGLTPGQSYRLGAAWDPRPYLTQQARYEVYDGDRLLRILSFNQQAAPSGFIDTGKAWSRLGVFQATSSELTVRMVNTVAGQQVAADAIIVQHVPGDRGLDDSFAASAGSSTIDAGDPSWTYTNEPTPNGGRVNQGHTGNTTQATTSPSRVVQVLSPNNLEKLEVGQQISITWSSDGINQIGSYSAAVLADTPRGYWRLGEASGTTAVDASGNNHTGTYLNDVALGRTGCCGE